MSWPHGPVQSEGPQGNSFGSSAFPGQQAKGDGQGNKSNRNFPLYIVNIPLDIDEDQLRKMFSEAGDVTYSKCLPPKEGRNSCVGFISYNTEEEAQKAISLFNNVQINRMTLRVDYTKSFKEGRSLKLDNAKSSFPSGQQDDQGSYSSHNGYSQRQDSPGLNSRESQPVDVHSIGRGIHFDYDDSGNQFHAIGGGIHPELLKSVPNDPGQGSYNPGSLPATHDFQPNYSETSNLKIPSSNLNGPLEPSAMQYGSSFYSHGYEEKSPQDMHSYHMNPQVQEARTVQGDPSFGTYNYHNVISQDVLSSYSEQTMQSTYTNRSQAPMSMQSNSSFENYNCQENLTENPQSGVNSPQIPSYSPVQGGHSTERTSEVKMDSLVNGFAGMEVTQPVNNHSFESNQYQVSSRLPRSQTGASFGERICHRCGEPGHFARECPKSSPGGDRNSNCYQCDQPGHFSRERPNRSVRGQRGGCHRCGEQDHFARECPNNGQEQEGSSPRPPQKVDYVPPPLPDDVDLLFKAAVHKGINFDRFDSIPVEVTGNNPTTAIQTFDELFLPDTLKSNLGKAEFTKPTPVQKYAIPIILNGRDIMACAQTGSGKTVAFLLPVMAGMVNSRLPEASYLGGDAANPAALCVAPTRELALQIYTEALKFSSGTYLRPVVCYGGVSVQYQLQNVERGCHILIGTPGRILDFVGRNKVSLTNVRYLILDEADRMLDMGFENDVRKIVCQFGMPEKTQRQTLMFSATFPDEIQKLAGEFLNDYLYLAVGRVGGSNLDIKQEILDLQNDQKRPTLLDIIRQSGQDKTLVFVERKRQADFLANWLSQNKYPTTSISGDRSQKEREDALRDFRNGRAPVLIATSVAARGLDIPDVKHVINYDLPQQIEDYVHRIGRTGRIGNQGSATAFFERGRDDKLARSLVKVLSDAVQDVPNWLEEVAERALGTSYGPAGGKFASRDTRQFDSRRSGNTGGDDSSRPSPTTNVSFTNQSFPRTSSVVENGDDEEEWD